MTANASRIALIGFGEVGSLFARELIATGRHSVATYDILFEAPQGAAMRERAQTLKVEPCATAAAAAADALVVISAVTATSAADVARGPSIKYASLEDAAYQPFTAAGH